MSGRNRCVNTGPGLTTTCTNEVQVMAMAIIPRIERGRLYFQTVEDLAPRFTVAVGRPAFVAKDGAR